MRAPLLSLTLAIMIGGLSAAPASAEGSAAAKPEKGSPDEKICRRGEETGTRLGPVKICKTRAQWEEQDRADRAELDRMQMRSCDRGTAC